MECNSLFKWNQIFWVWFVWFLGVFWWYLQCYLILFIQWFRFPWCMSGFALTFSLLCLGQKCSVIHLRMLQHCLHRPACSFFWIVSYFSILHKWFLMESLNEEMSNQLWKMNIKHLCKVPYIKQESPQASRYYLSILCWFYMPVYSSKKKPKQPNIRYLGNVVMLSSDIQTKFSRHTQTVGRVNLWHCRNMIWSANFMAIFILHF